MFQGRRGQAGGEGDKGEAVGTAWVTAKLKGVVHGVC